MDLHYSQTPCLRRSMCRCFTTLWIYTILKPRGSREFVTLVLLPYGFTLFSNGVSLHYIKYIVLLPYGFTLFSNRLVVLFSVLWFYYLMDLHYSQTSLTELKRICSFTTLWIYTILKPHCWPLAGCTGFTTLWIYTILKPQISCAHYTAQGKSTRSSTIVLWRNGIVKGAQIPIQHIEFGAHIYAHRRLAL